MSSPTQLPKYYIETVVGYFKRVGDIQIFIFGFVIHDIIIFPAHLLA